MSKESSISILCATLGTFILLYVELCHMPADCMFTVFLMTCVICFFEVYGILAFVGLIKKDVKNMFSNILGLCGSITVIISAIIFIIG